MSDVPPPQPPQQPGEQPPPPPPGMPAAPSPAGDAAPPQTAAPSRPSTGKTVGVAIGAVVAIFAVAGVVFGLTRNGGDDEAVRTTTPEVPAVTVPEVSTPVVSDAPASTVVESIPADTTPIATAPPETDAPTTTELEATATTVEGAEPAGETVPPFGEADLTEIGQLFTWTSFSEAPLDDAAVQVEVDQLIVTRSVEAAAHPTAVAAICGGIPMDAAFDLSVVWQFDGETVQSDAFQGAPPGVGTCIRNDGEPLAAGSYQVFASNADETEVGFVTTFVIGATEVVQSFVNNTALEICDIGVAPTSTSYYEFFTSTDGPILPGEFINIAVASLEQDLRVRTCAGDDLDGLTFSPTASADQPMTP